MSVQLVCKLYNKGNTNTTSTPTEPKHNKFSTNTFMFMMHKHEIIKGMQLDRTFKYFIISAECTSKISMMQLSTITMNIVKMYNAKSGINDLEMTKID